MVREKDLGSSLLFFAVFAAMLYIATDRASYLFVALAMFLAGAFVAYQLFGHVQDRVSSWIDPWSVAQTKGFQLVQSMYALGSGGFQGTGLGLGSPQKIPNASTDFVLSANFDAPARSGARAATSKGNGASHPGSALPPPAPAHDEGHEPSPRIAPR